MIYAVLHISPAVPMLQDVSVDGPFHSAAAAAEHAQLYNDLDADAMGIVVELKPCTCHSA